MVGGLCAGVAGLVLLAQSSALATDWPQYRGPATDGSSPDPISTNWPVAGPPIVWTNTSITNGFRTFAVSEGRAFALMSKRDASGNLREYCTAVNAATGANLWATPIGDAPWDPTVNYNGGAGAFSYDTGDGPRTTPSVSGNRVVALSGFLHLVCLDAVTGSVVWSNDLVSAYGASTITYENAASPCLDHDLVFVSLNTSFNNLNLAAFRVSDGSLAWSSQPENVTHATPVVATIHGVRQVIFATPTGLVSLDRSSGSFLWKYTYPFFPIETSMGASPVVHSNFVFCTASYGRGAAAAQINLTNGIWSAQQLFYKTGPNYRSIWMTPVCVDGYIYTMSGDNVTFLTTPLNCIELSTGNLMWSTNNFGMGGLILVDRKLLILTENGQLVLVDPSPSAYRELARYQVFHFSPTNRGKCWISPAFSNGRIYARSTRGGICLDVSVPGSAPLNLLPPRYLTATQLELMVSTVDGSPIDSNRLAKIELRASDRFDLPIASWPKLINQLALDANGRAWTTVAVNPGQPRRFYRAVQLP